MTVLAERIKRLEEGIHFAAACIRAGEPWTDTVEKTLTNALRTDFTSEPRKKGPTMFPDLEERFTFVHEPCKRFTMTSVERMYDLYKSVEYVSKREIPGDIVECGVWKGGSMMLVAHTLNMLRDQSRTLVLFDTFEGLPKPDIDKDIDCLGNNAAERWRENWAMASLDEVRINMASTGYPSSKVRFVKGMVEDTLADYDYNIPVALARLDTDWYASTKTELEKLWPRISLGGILIIDDYGHWLGAREAVDEYFADRTVKMTRVDYSCRVIQK
jgi:O-methyltransferase